MNRIEVRCGLPLAAADKQRIEGFFRKQYGESEFVYLADPKLIGGFVAQCGDEVWDASVSSKLGKLKSDLS